MRYMLHIRTVDSAGRVHHYKTKPVPGDQIVGVTKLLSQGEGVIGVDREDGTLALIPVKLIIDISATPLPETAPEG